MVVLITRAASAKDKSIPGQLEVEQLLLPFKDKEEISHWARTETAIALKLGLIQGTGPDQVSNPKPMLPELRQPR